MTKNAVLTGATLETAPTVCHECIFWQSRTGRSVDKRRWIRGTEEEWGAWGTVYYDDDGRLLGSMQYGPAGLFPRAADLPAGPPSDDAVIVTCAYLAGDGARWVEQSRFLAAIGEARDRGAKALEAFAYRYPEGESGEDGVRGQRTGFPGVARAGREARGAVRHRPSWHRLRRPSSREAGGRSVRATRRESAVHAETGAS